jgi:predicted nucleic acid-binding Zn ribbon protein
MPKYEYLCEKGHEVVVEQRITEDALTECQFLITLNEDEMLGLDGYGVPIYQAKCGAPCRRLISKTSFVLKGTGWTPKGGI